MNRKLFKNIIAVVIVAFLALTLATPVLAQVDIGTNYGANLGLGNADPRDMAVSVIQVILGFLAIIVVILILYGGFLWMTAAGNEDKVDTAKKIITAGVVGLVIIMAAWGIAKFVVEAILEATYNA